MIDSEQNNSKQIKDASEGKIIVEKGFGGIPRSKDFYERMRSYGEGVVGSQENDEKEEIITEDESKFQKYRNEQSFSSLKSKKVIYGAAKATMKNVIEKDRAKLIRKPDETRESFSELDNLRGDLSRAVSLKQPSWVLDNLNKLIEKEKMKLVSSDDTDEVVVFEGAEDVVKNRESLAGLEKKLEEKRLGLARHYVGLKEKKLGYFGDVRVHAVERAHEIALEENQYRNYVDAYRKLLLDQKDVHSRDELEDILLKTTVEEAKTFYSLKQKIRLEKRGESFVDKVRVGSKRI